VRTIPTPRETLQDLSAHLAVEYSGAVAPGRVLALVLRAERRLRHVVLEPGSRLDLIETRVRRQLAESTARPRPEAGQGP
jgi:hypothetical protein